MCFSTSAKKKKCYWDLDRNFSESIDSFGCYGHFNINSSNPQTWDSFHQCLILTFRNVFGLKIFYRFYDLFFSCLTALVRTSSTILKRGCESGYLCIFPDLRGKALNLSLLNMMLAVDFSYRAFSILRYIPSILNLLRVFFNHKLMLNFVKWIYCTYWNDHIIFLFHSMNMMNQLTELCVCGTSLASQGQILLERWMTLFMWC